MKTEFDFFILTLCSTDLECQEIEFFNHEQAQEAAQRLERFLPKSVIHSIVLEGIKQITISIDEDGCPDFKEERTELSF